MTTPTLDLDAIEDAACRGYGNGPPEEYIATLVKCDDVLALIAEVRRLRKQATALCVHLEQEQRDAARISLLAHTYRREITATNKGNERLAAERDAAIARAEAAERERDAALAAK